MKRNLLAAIVVLLVGSLVASQLAVANFNAATGFSGRHGFTCTSCHNVPDGGPASGDEIYDEPAAVTIEGLPDEWDQASMYELTITVTGGPPAAPSPAPQGGFEIEADRGFFSVPEGMGDFIDVYAEDERAVTYTVDGTQMRQWRVTWNTETIPTGQTDNIFGPRWMQSEPRPVTFWVAAMAANGNHVVAAEQSDGGELGDSVDNTTATIPPSQETVDAWMEYRLLPPLVDGETLADRYVTAFEPFEIAGIHWDDEADALAYSLDGMEWESLPTTGLEWRLAFGDGLTPGEHTLLLRSESADGRMSETSTVVIHVEPLAEEGEVETPLLSLPILLAVLVALTRRRQL